MAFHFKFKKYFLVYIIEKKWTVRCLFKNKQSKLEVRK